MMTVQVSASLKKLPFPAKQWLRSMKEEKLRERATMLETWINGLLQVYIGNLSPEWACDAVLIFSLVRCLQHGRMNADPSQDIEKSVCMFLAEDGTVTEPSFLEELGVSPAKVSSSATPPVRAADFQHGEVGLPARIHQKFLLSFLIRSDAEIESQSNRI
jgi:hypothetical protein